MQAIHVSQRTAVAVHAMRKHRCDSEACCEGRLQGAGTVMLISSPSPPPTHVAYFDDQAQMRLGNFVQQH